MKKTIRFFVFALALMLIIGTVTAPATVTNAVKGIICDSHTEEPVPDVRVTVVSTRTQTNRFELKSDRNGAVYKNGVPTGEYEVHFEKEGYFPARSNIRLGIGDNFDISIKLEPVPEQQGGSSDSLRAVVELVNAGKFAEGIQKAGVAIEKEPNNAMLHYYRGYCREKSGDAAKAIVDYGRAVELKSDFILALTSLAKLQARRGEYTLAAETYKKALELKPDDPDALYNYSICLVNLGNNTEAGTALEKLLGIDPNHADACYQLGIVLLGQGEIIKAKKYLQKFLTLAPEHKDAATARQIIESIK